VTDPRRALFEDAVRALVSGDTDGVASLFTEDVVGWSPVLSVSSLAELQAEVAERDDALSNLEITVDSIDFIGDKAIAEWRVAADHTGPLLIDDDLLVEPTGRHVILAGVIIAEFRGNQIRAFRTYFDDAALLEQMLLPE
jgi:ketosteroid isomerase-like protein